MKDPAAILKGSGEHYVWGDACDAWFLLKRDDVHVIEERMPPAASEVAHYHRQARQLFYILTGELTINFGPRSVVLRAREALAVEPGTPHRAANESVAPVEFLVISCPPSHGDRIACS